MYKYKTHFICKYINVAFTKIHRDTRGPSGPIGTLSTCIYTHTQIHVTDILVAEFLVRENVAYVVHTLCNFI